MSEETLYRGMTQACPANASTYPFAMRWLALSVLLSSPATAWEASRDGPICRLSHEASDGTVVVTHDPRQAEPYAIQVRRAQSPWTESTVFAMRFDGPGQLTITTDRHRLQDSGATLIVTDRGFENVLRGLEANRTATAILGDQVLAFPLDGAAPEVALFRACAQGVGV